MKQDIQTTLFQIIKERIAGEDTIGNALSEVLSISSDAVYRRYRGETALTIQEIRKICIHYGISFDALCELGEGKAVFTYPPLNTYDFSLETYLRNILESLEKLSKLTDTQLIIAATNTPFFQLLNFPQLVRFKLYFWAKTHLQVPNYQKEKFRHEKTSDNAFALGRDILQLYNSIPSKEIYDPELMRSFLRQIHFYYKAHLFEDPSYALFLCDRVLLMSSHLKDQAEHGKKFIYGTHPPASGNDYELFFNETTNSETTIYYTSKEISGISISHNIMNYLQTTDPAYVADTRQILEKHMSNSSLISVINERDRNNYFYDFDRTIKHFRQKIEIDLAES